MCGSACWKASRLKGEMIGKKVSISTPFFHIEAGAKAPTKTEMGGKATFFQ
jgi:hypothetical protein